MPRSPLAYLRHILTENGYLISAIQGMSKHLFMHSETLKRAFVRSLAIIGEASKKIHSALQQKYPEINWRAIAGMSNRLFPDNFGVDYDIV